MARKRIALCCDGVGRISEILRDDLGVLGDSALGSPLVGHVAEASSGRCFEMLAELRRDSAIFGWHLEIESPEGGILFHFAGAQDGDRALLVASDDLQDVGRFNEELMRINNEHVNELRAVIQKRARARPGPDGDLMDQVTSLSNEVTTLQRQLAQRNADLERALVEKNQLMGMWAHDMRSPLMVAAGFASHLAHDPGLTERHRTVATEIDGACSRITGLVDEMVDWAALESAAIRIDSEAVDLVTLATAVARLHDLAAQGTGVKVACRADGAVSRAQADPRRIQQVLDNLISNALRVAPQASTVEVQVADDADSVLLTVTDAGPGIDTTSPAALFDPFTRGESERRPGWGLGLAIVKRLVELQGGSIEVASQVGEGARFQVRLPRAEADGPG